MPSNPIDKARVGWYTVSVDTLRGLGDRGRSSRWSAASATSPTGAGRARSSSSEAAALLEEVDVLLARARAASSRPARFGEELDVGAARPRHGARRLRGRRVPHRGRQGAARRAPCCSRCSTPAARAPPARRSSSPSQGGVELRRGERANGRRRAAAVVLQSGDYVKTSANGSAEIVFLDGTLYTVRPNTLFLVTRQPGTAVGAGTEQTIAMEYGWVNLNTAQRGGRVTTPRAEARVARDSEAVVSYDQATATGALLGLPRRARGRPRTAD